MSPASHAPLCTRQGAYAFNQPLTFDTSSVTDMQYMFSVRSAPAHATHSPVGPTPRVTQATAPAPSRLLALRIARMLCLPLDSAEHECVQPVAEYQHVSGHSHE